MSLEASGQKPEGEGTAHSVSDVTGCGHYHWKGVNTGWGYKCDGGTVPIA